MHTQSTRARIGHQRVRSATIQCHVYRTCGQRNLSGNLPQRVRFGINLHRHQTMRRALDLRRAITTRGNQVRCSRVRPSILHTAGHRERCLRLDPATRRVDHIVSQHRARTGVTMNMQVLVFIIFFHVDE